MINIPGSNSATLIGQVISVGTPSLSMCRPPTLSLSEKAYVDIKAQVLCRKFYGCLMLSNKECSKSLVILSLKSLMMVLF